MNTTIYIDYKNKKIPVKITKATDAKYKNIETAIYVDCIAAWFYQERDLTDLQWLLELLPDLIQEQRQKEKNSVLQIRLTTEEKEKIRENAQKNWYPSVSAYIKSVSL